QTGTPLEIYQRPVSRFVAEFMGSPPINMIELTNGVDSSAIQAITRWLDTQAMAAASVGIRQESLNFTREATSVTISAVALTVSDTSVVSTGRTWVINITVG